MKNVNLKLSVLMLSALTLGAVSCQKEGCTDSTATNYDEKAKKDDGSCIAATEETTLNITSNITTNTTWEKGKVYVLTSRITVVSGVTLTIEPGTIIKGQAGTGANATALIIARGGKIMAEGTAAEPIIFTSVADEIQPGQIDGGNLDVDLDGLWGGLIVLGNAPISADASSVQIEGIPASDPNGLYGGSVADDNSGVIKYVSIRHGGANIGEGNEINGLTLGGVGSGTVIENVEVVANQDDGIEFFGGTVNVKNAIVWAAGDDAIDTDQAWSGTLDNFVVVCGGATDHALEIDGPEGALLAGHTVRNGSIKGSTSSELGDFRSSARGAFENLFFFGFPNPATDGRGDFSLSSGSDVTFASSDLTFSNLNVILPAGVDLSAVFKNGTVAHAASVSARGNLGANLTPFATWTLTSSRGELTNF